MRPEDLKEAEQIVARLAWLETARGFSFDATGGVGTLRVVTPDFNLQVHRSTELNLSRPAASAALAVLQREWASSEAETRRRAAQIGLVLP